MTCGACCWEIERSMRRIICLIIVLLVTTDTGGRCVVVVSIMTTRTLVGNDRVSAIEHIVLTVDIKRGGVPVGLCGMTSSTGG